MSYINVPDKLGCQKANPLKYHAVEMFFQRHDIQMHISMQQIIAFCVFYNGIKIIAANKSRSG